MSSQDNTGKRKFHERISPMSAALALANLGIPVIPLCPHDHAGVSEKHKNICKRPGKAPLIKDWQNRASSDPEQLAEWYTRWPCANIGLVLGSKTGILAIDVDGEYGRKKLEELSKGNLPPTWEYETPGGGYRYLYRAPDGYPFAGKSYSSPKGGHEGLELLGDGQQTVMPGSVHTNGRPYVWAEGRNPDDLPLADAPEWMLRLMSANYSADRLFSGENDGRVTGSPIASRGPTRPSASASTSASTSAFTDTPTDADILEVLKEMPTLTRLTESCPAIRHAVRVQITVGCDENTWFLVISLLCRLGAEDEAMAFSRLSNKHNDRSEYRIEKAMADTEAKAYGPPRCSTFGCGPEQAERCFGLVLNNHLGEQSNSPAWFLTRDPGALKRAGALFKGTGYRIKNGKLGEPIFNKNGQEQGFSAIGNFVAIPVRDVCLDNGAETFRLFEFECVLLSDGRTLPPLKVRHSDFADLKWIADWGLEPNLEPGPINRERMRHAIQQLAGNARRVQVYAHLGFRQISGRWRYLHAGGCVGEPEVLVEMTDPRLAKYTLPNGARDAKAAVRQSLALLEVAKPGITTPLLATVYLAPLCEALRTAGIEPSFVVWIHGQTGTRKSTLAALFLSHFGDFSPKGPPASFRDTANSLERRAFDAKDTVLWIDDFHPTGNPAEARKMEQTAQATLRAYGDRAGRGRMGPDATLRADYPPRGLAVATGEQFPDGHSSNARLQGVEVAPGDVDLAKLTEAQAQSFLLAEAMAEYVKWVGERMDDPSFPGLLRQKFQERRELALPGQSHGRLAETAAWLYLGLDYLLEFALEVGAVTEEERQRRLAEGWETLLALSEAQSEQVLDARPAEQFLSVVAGMLQNGTIHVLPADRREREKYEGLSLPGTHVGWEDDQYFYFLPDIIYNVVNDFLRKQDERVPLKQSALWKQLEAEGCLVPGVEKDNGKEKIKRRRKKVVDGKKVQTVWIRRECLEEPEEGAADRERARRASLAREAGKPGENPFGDE